MKKKPAPRAPATSFKGFAIVGALVCAAVGVILLAKRPSPTPPAARIVSEEPVRVLGWRIADYLLSQRDHYRRDIVTTVEPEWTSFTPAYFTSLKERKDAVIAWASGRSKPVPVDFIGLIHVKIAEQNTPEELARIDAIQTERFEVLKARASGASVVAIEETGSDAVMTPDEYLRITRDTFQNLFGLALPPDAELLAHMRQDRQAATRAIMEGLPAPVICGEEWPIHFETRLLRRPPDPARPAADAAIYDLTESLNELRSEIILIRALEFLKRTDGRAAIILQGSGHGRFLERVATEYHVALTVL